MLFVSNILYLRNNVPRDVTTEHKVNASDLRLQAKEEISAYDFVEGITQSSDIPNAFCFR